MLPSLITLITTSYFLSFPIPNAKKPSLETLISFLSIITFELGSVLPIIKCPWINLPSNCKEFALKDIKKKKN